MFLSLTKLAIIGAFLLSVFTEVNAAKCTNPAVRKEWRKLSKDEKANWIQAVNCLSKLPHDDSLSPTVNPSDIAALNTSGSYYDDIVYMHMDLNHVIHNTGLFLPWHRWFVHFFETALTNKCGYTGASPYWDWASDAADVYGSTLFADNSTTSGLGGWGNPTNDYEVPAGGLSDFHLSYPSPHILRRNFTLQPWAPFAGSQFFTEPEKMANTSFTQTEVSKMVNGFSGDFKGFQKYMEGFEGAHGAVHLIFGGDLGGTCPTDAPSDCVGGPTFSPNEPIFFMHHAMVDKIWYDWQHKNSSNFKAFEGGSVQAIDNMTEYETYPNGADPALTFDSLMPTDGMFDQASIQDIMDTTNGYLCYAYE